MPVNLFDANFYRAANSDLASLDDAQALAHFQTNGLNEGRAFSPFANLSFYRANNSDLATLDNQQLLAHLQNTGVAEGRRFSQFADLNYYLTLNPDLNQAFGGSREQAFEHLRNSGVNEGRSFSPFIDLNYYLSTNPDINQALGGNRGLALQNLEIYGLREGRQFSPAFDINYYQTTYPDLASAGLTTNPSLFDHWVTIGAPVDRRSGTPDPGNSLGAALNIGSLVTSSTLFNNSVGSSSDTLDYYSFSLSEPRNIFTQLSGLSADLDLVLLDSSGNVIEASSGDGPAQETILFSELSAGTYFFRVNQGVAAAASNYSLSVSVLPAQDPGNVLTAAYPVINLFPPTNVQIRGLVGGSDTDDYYALNLTSTNSFGSALLTPFGSNADLYLLNANGETIAFSTAAGTAADSIPAVSLAAGTYFIRIPGGDTITDYRLVFNTVV